MVAKADPAGRRRQANVPGQLQIPAEAEQADIVYFDLETQKLFEDVGGTRNVAALGLALAVTYSTRLGAFRTFHEQDAEALARQLQEASLVVGFNILNFDYRVLEPYVGPLAGRTRSLDMLSEIQKVLGFRLKLETLARATLQAGKSADGVQSVRWFREGRLDLVEAYCRQDVEITRQLFEFGYHHGVLYYLDRQGNRHTVPATWGRQQQNPASGVARLALG